MNQKTIRCLMHYDTHDNTQNRHYHLAAGTKAEYVFSCFNRLGYDVEVISASTTKGKKYAKGMVKVLRDDFRIRLFGCMGRGSRIKSFIATRSFALRYGAYLFFHVKKNDVLWAYHSLGLINCLTVLKKFRKFHLILEVEELYGDVIVSEKASRREKKFVKLADAYVFPSKQLDELMNTEHKPSVISHGTYDVTEPDPVGFGDGKIHVAYAGTLDPRMGSHSVVEMAKLLDEGYHVHILGGGKPEEIRELQSRVEAAQEGLRCKLTYEGILKGKDYTDFIRKCHIGLCPHQLNATFNNTAFPSKILSYMANGMQVVSIRIPVIEESDVGQYLHYYDGDSVQDFARAVREVDLTGAPDSRRIIRELDEVFRQSLGDILGSFES